MKCKDIRYLISAYVDGNLTAEEELSVKAHIEFCKECADFYKDLQNVRQLMLSANKKQTTADFTDAVMNKINSAKPEVSVKNNVYTIFARRRKLVAAAAAFLFIIAGSSFYIFNKPSVPDSSLVNPAMLFEFYDDFVGEETLYDGDVASFLYTY